MVQQSGGTVPVKSSRACVVYDADTGHVHHIHQVVTLEGGREPNESEIEAHAMALARRKERRAGRFKALHLAADAVRPHQLYTVDLKTRALVVKQRNT
jgi:hypothetical protein